MLLVNRHGEGVLVDVGSGSRLRDPEVRRLRALEMLVMKRAGQPTSLIARKYRLSMRQVQYDIRAAERAELEGKVGPLPSWRRRIDGLMG